MPRKPVTTVLLLVAVLGSLVTAAVTAPAAPAPRHVANRGWDAPSADVVAELD